MIRLGVLTSSRADFGIYLPLLNRLKADAGFELNLVVFGTHLSPFHGYTVDHIKSAGFDVLYEIESMLLSDSSDSIATAMGLTTIKFAGFWRDHAKDFDLVFCLGDRYEMFSAVMAGIPFQIPFAHLHGGETTLGAIDNVFRHAITLASKFHFVSTPGAANRIKEIVNNDAHIYYVGALGLDNLSDLKLLTIDEFKQKWSVDLSKQTILVTFHPETVGYKENERYADELVKTIHKVLCNYQVLITMPNADTAGNIIRKAFTAGFSGLENIFLIENLGSADYFTAMKHCSFLLGNTSSGIIEAASLGKYVIDIGDRQKGRITGENVIHVPIDMSSVLDAVQQIEVSGDFAGRNIYFNNGAADQIINILKQN